MTPTTTFKAFLFTKQNVVCLLLTGMMTLFLFVATALSLPVEKSKTTKYPMSIMLPKKDSVLPSEILFTFVVPEDVKVKDYFAFMNNMTRAFDSILPYKLTEHILIRYNSFVIDTLMNTDYYRMKARKIFVYDQKQLTVLKKGTLLYVPTLAVANRLKAKMARTVIDVNVPEFKLRIMEGNDTIYTCRIRVGQNKMQFYPEAGRDLDMRTRTGLGFVANVHKKDYSFDPITGKKYTGTQRDDKKFTMMPLLPWLEPKINGELRGQWIHPTTNPRSLGQAYSNGCMGTSEADIWRIYYYAPLDTKVVIRYDLTIKNEKGELTQLKDVYNIFTPPTNPNPISESSLVREK